LHIGGARTALFNWLYARKHQGPFVLRIEDTDQERSTPESVKAILDGLKWLGIDWDEGPEVGGPYAPYFQTQRLAGYRALVEKMIAEGKAYRCYCTRDELDERRAIFEKQKRTYLYEGTCRDRQDVPAGRTSVVRFKKPSSDGSVSFTDKVLGRISKPLSDLDDWVMARHDGLPLYNFGCVVDDHQMDVTLVGRGQEHINSTFPQLMLYEALGWTPPEFAHFPLILGPDREKLSKRKHPEADVMLHKRNGIHPEALLNFVVRLGWSHGDEETISREQMIEWFDFDHVGSTSGVWNPEKLLWLNQHYMKTLPPEKVAERLVPFLAEKGITEAMGDKLQKLVLALRGRAATLAQMADMAKVFYSAGVTFDDKAAAKFLTAETKPVLAAVRDQLSQVAWTCADLDGVIKTVAEKAALGMGKVAQPVRVAVTGGTTSPGIGETLELVGRDESLRRLDTALGRIG
jgi:glutamyl-tRNA synthetase